MSYFLSVIKEIITNIERIKALYTICLASNALKKTNTLPIAVPIA